MSNSKPNMTRSRRHHQSSSESAASYSSANDSTHRRRTTTPSSPTLKTASKVKDHYNNNDEDDDADASEYSQEDEYESQEQEDTEEEEDDDNNNVNGATYSESVSNNNNSNITPLPNNSSAYVNIAPLPIFRGAPSESPVAHLSRFNKVCRANNASSTDMQKRIFAVTLEDEAALWYDLNVEPYYSSLTWEETKLCFLQAYYTVEAAEDLRSELMGLRRGVGESVRSYFVRLQWILKRWPENGLGEDLIVGVFVEGLGEGFRDWVLVKKPVSLSEALRLAFEFERVRGKEGCVKKKQCHKCGKNKVLIRNSSGIQSSRISR